jgi:hypothetical protein
MKYRRCASMLIAAAIAATAVMASTSSPAGAVTSGAPSSAQPAEVGVVPASSMGSQAARPTAARSQSENSQECDFNPVQYCDSTDLTVSVDWASDAGAIQDSCVADVTINWGDGTPVQDVTVISTAPYNFLATHTYATDGPETITLGGSSETPDCYVIPGTLYFNQYDHYVVTTEAWIPFAGVVDPELPLITPYPQTLDYPWSTYDPNCYFPKFLQAWTTTVSSTYRGDGHTGFGGSYRLATEVSFDFDPDTDQIMNFTSDAIAPVGTTSRDKVYSSRGKIIATCTQTGMSTNTQTAAQDSDTTFTIGYSGKDPLVQPAFLAPPITASIIGSVDAEGDLALGYKTTQFPSQGIQVTINGQTVLTTIENDASCLPARSVLGPFGALTLVRGLNSHTTGIVLATPGGDATSSTPSPLC